MPPYPPDSATETSLLHEVGDVLELGVLTLDSERTITGWNRWLEIASGRTAGDVVGRRIDDAFPDFRDSYGDRALGQVFAGATVVMAHRFHEYFLCFPPPPGEKQFEYMQQSTRILPLAPDGRITGAVVLIEDVTERVARETELYQALHRAEAANRAKSDFLATMSHELRTPLAAISGYADLILQQMAGPVSHGQEQHLGRMKSLSSHLLRIVDEILTFSRLQAGREEIHLEKVDAVVVAREAAAAVEPLVTRKALEFRVCLPSGQVAVVTDEMKLTQILINLLGNAAKFVQAGHVGFSMRSDDKCVQFEVADTGPGIDAADVRRVFEPFTQVDTALRRREYGTGLGLPVSRQLAQLLGGDVTLVSERGKGSTFTLTLPLTPPKPGSEPR